MKHTLLFKLSLALLTATVFVTSNTAMARPGNDVRRDRDFNQESSETIVRILYQGLLNRQPDYEGLRNWSQRIINEGRGAIPSVAADIGSSNEFLNIVRTRDLNSVVENMYLVLLNRSSLRDIQGRIGWVDNLARCAQFGDSNCLRNVVSGFANSEEFLNNNVSQVLNRIVYSVKYEVTGNLRVDSGTFQSSTREQITESCIRRLYDVGFGAAGTRSVYQANAGNINAMAGRGEAPKSVSEACAFLANNARIN